MKLLFTALLASALSLGRDKTDILVMKNGDRITCEIKKLEGGVLLASLDYVDGNISIDWQKVDRVESQALFSVKLQDGTTFAGTMITQERDGVRVLEIQPANSEEQVPVSQNAVVGLDQASYNFFHRFNGGINIGSQYSKGNSTTQYSLSSDLAYQESRWAVRARYSSSLSSSTGVETATRNQADLSGYRLMRRKNYFYQGGVAFLQSTVQSIQRQWGVAGGLGVFLKDTNHLTWTIQGGPAWQRTHYVPSPDSPDTQNILGFLGSSSLEAFRFKKTRLTTSVTVLPALNDIGRYFLRTNATYYLKLFGQIDWNFSAYLNLDSRPPEHLQGSDYGTSTGFSYSFGNH